MSDGRGASAIASYIPISEELIEDSAHIFAWMRLLAERQLTAQIFDEDWSGPGEEMDRLELGARVHFDPRYWPDEFDDEW